MFSDKYSSDDKELISVIKSKKLSLNENGWNEYYEFKMDKLKIGNAAFFYQVANIFYLQGLQKTVFSCIKRCFSMVVETKSFLELDYMSTRRILAESKLQIFSELEVYNAVNTWLRYNVEERSKFAKDLLLKVRLPLLSNRAIKYILDQPSSICNIGECVQVLNEVLDARNNLYQNKSSAYYTTRYFDGKMFSILVCGGRHNSTEKTTKNVIKLDANNFELEKMLHPMKKKRYSSRAVCLKGEVYVLGGRGISGKWLRSVEKYSPSTDEWNKVGELCDDRMLYCACAFIDKVFVIGGVRNGSTLLDNCLQFDTKSYKWKEVARMGEARQQTAACANFKGLIVVSGGTGGLDIPFRRSNKVESYDAAGDAWTPMPRMIEQRAQHSSMVVKNKMFVFGGIQTELTAEVLDDASKQFVALKPVKSNILNCETVSVGSKIFFIQSDTFTGCINIFCYDVDAAEWRKQKSTGTCLDVKNFSLVKLPFY